MIFVWMRGKQISMVVLAPSCKHGTYPSIMYSRTFGTLGKRRGNKKCKGSPGENETINFPSYLCAGMVCLLSFTFVQIQRCWRHCQMYLFLWIFRSNSEYGFNSNAGALIQRNFNTKKRYKTKKKYTPTNFTIFDCFLKCVQNEIKF